MKSCKGIVDDICTWAGASVTDYRLVPVSGGDINDNYILELRLGNVSGNKQIASVYADSDVNPLPVEASHGEWPRFFLKIQKHADEDFFTAEQEGLEALGRVKDAPRVPKVFFRGRAGRDQYLLMEYIKPGRNNSGSRLGSGLAALHNAAGSRLFGFAGNNYIGRTPQLNGWDGSWISFFRDKRLGYQIQLAASRGLLDSPDISRLERLMVNLGSYLDEPDHPALLHGDLWGGNCMTDTHGKPVLIDPAVYYGHPEADIAMTELFGGFGRDFYRAYSEAAPLAEGYCERKEVYNLYHLLNHLNMFGRSYLSSVRGIVAHYS